MSEKKSEQSLEKSSKSIDVLELDDAMLDLVNGGSLASVDLNGKCSTNSGCNTVAGCGGGGSTSPSSN